VIRHRRSRRAQREDRFGHLWYPFGTRGPLDAGGQMGVDDRDVAGNRMYRAARMPPSLGRSVVLSMTMPGAPAIVAGTRRLGRV
jgi:hypothetical protein